MSLAQALFAPRSVALIGASGDAAKNTARPQRYLRKHGYTGKIFPVNPTRKEIFGEKAYARVSDIPEAVDHAYILIEDVEQALEDCGRRGVAVASVFSGGFSAAEHGQEWSKVLTTDARFTETGRISRGLASYVHTTWSRVGQRLFGLAAGEGTVLFLHGAGLLGRYFEDGGRELLTGLQNAARRSADAPRGLWLLCPAESELDTPRIEGLTVEVLDTSERAVLSRAFLDGLRGTANNAA